MNSYEIKEYVRLREKGWHAKQALHAAKVKVAFGILAREGFVRLRVEPDDDWDDSHLDDREVNTEEQAKEERERANHYGVWGAIVEARNPLSGDGGPWECIDSCWGFVGDDWQDSGYDTDFYENAIDWLAQFEGMAA